MNTKIFTLLAACCLLLCVTLPPSAEARSHHNNHGIELLLAAGILAKLLHKKGHHHHHHGHHHHGHHSGSGLSAMSVAPPAGYTAQTYDAPAATTFSSSVEYPQYMGAASQVYGVPYGAPPSAAAFMGYEPQPMYGAPMA